MESNPTSMERYRNLEHRLRTLRLRVEGESQEEDRLLDEMDSVWRRLSDDEQAALRGEGATCWPPEKVDGR